MKLLFRVTALIIAILLLAFGLIFYITWTSNVKTLDAQAKTRLEELAFNVMDKIDRILFERTGDLEAIATDPIIRSRDSSPRQITERLIIYRNIYKTYVSLSFLDLDRTRIADTAGLDLGKQVEKQQYWDDVMQGKLSIASAIGLSGSLNLPVIFFASPVKDKDKQLIGIVVTRMPVDKLYDIVGQISTMTPMNGALYIDLVSRDGLLIYSNYNRRGMLKEKVSYWETAKNLRGNMGFIKAHQHPGQEESVAVFCREQGYFDFKGNGWTLVIHVPTRIVFAPVVELRKKMLIVIVPSILLSIILALWFSFRLSRPLTVLRDAVIAFGKGNLDTKAMIESRDEIGELGKVFNQMGEALKKTTTSIDNLEREITERKKIEDELKESTLRYRSLFESSRDAIMIVGPPFWEFISGNTSALQMFKVGDEAEFISFGPWGLSPQMQLDGRASAEKAKEMIETAIREGSHFFEWVHKRITGEEFFASVLLTRVELGGKIFVQATVRDITERKKAAEEREKLIVELRASLENVKMLSGLLPICASCKKIRDDKGYWNQIESYIRDHSEAEFSHGICPECMKKLYPDFKIVE